MFADIGTLFWSFYFSFIATQCPHNLCNSFLSGMKKFAGFYPNFVSETITFDTTFEKRA